MGKYVTRITHKGREILALQIANSSEEDRLQAWEEARQEILKHQGVYLLLVDVRHITLAPKSLSKAKEAAAAVRAHPGNRLAFVGLSGLQKSTTQLAIRRMGIRAHFCNSPEEAMEWLVEEDTGRRQSIQEQRR